MIEMRRCVWPDERDSHGYYRAGPKRQAGWCLCTGWTELAFPGAQIKGLNEAGSRHRTG